MPLSSSSNSPSSLDRELGRLRIDKSKKRRRKSKFWPLTFFVLLVGGGAAGGFAYYQANFAPVEVELATAAAVDGSGAAGGAAGTVASGASKNSGSPAAESAATILTAGGYIIPRNSIQVTSKIIARVQEVLVKRGDQVKKGDDLIRLDDSDYRAQLRMSQARLASANARLAELRAGARPQEIQAAQGVMDAARATMQGAKDDMDRMSGLESGGKSGSVVSAQEMQRARTAYNVSAANFESARRNYELIKAGPRIEDINAAAASVGEAQANIDYAQTQLDLTVIHAPVDGTILEKVAEVGELVTNANYGGTSGPQTSVVQMANLKDLQVEIDLNESDIAKVQLGQPGDITLDSVPGATFHGVIDELAPQAERQKSTVQVKVKINDPDARVRPGTYARVTFIEMPGQRAAREKSGADSTAVNDSAKNNTSVPGASGAAAAAPKHRVRIPQAALIADADREIAQGEGSEASVFLVLDDVAHLTKVTLGKSAPASTTKGGVAPLVELSSGLNPGEHVVVSPPAKLADGRKVKIKASTEGFKP